MKKIVVIAFSLLALFACNRPAKLIILHTNDTHSHFEAEKSGEYVGRGGVIERAAFVDSVRAAEDPENVLLLHAGDFGQGTAYFSELEGTLEPEMLNALEYDVTTLGNHEFDNDIEALYERVKKLTKTKVVCANVDLSQFPISEIVKPYTIVERAGRKIGVIGLEADLSTNVSKTISSRFQQFDNVEVVNKWADQLRNEDQCDMVIVLSHAGYEEDQALVPQVHGVDLVIGGHSHTFVDDLLYVADADGKQVPIITDGMWGLEMGKLTIR